MKLYLKMDKNGNKRLHISTQKGGFSVQTNGALPRTHSEPCGRLSGGAKDTAIIELYDYVWNHGTKRQILIVGYATSSLKNK